ESIVSLVNKIFDGDFPLPKRKFLNVNIPPIPSGQCKGFKVTRAGNRLYAHNAEVHYNPRGKEYYWIGLPELGWMDTKGHTTDFEAVNDGYVSVTPVTLDMTSYEDIKILGEWL
ncbi:MAG TPA: 5'/3'-nucleotidase SurE, partial [Epsilonproteobacteria bacterium]|nr:5'/3'-nucleotidase SurE [Campylobacterota bacterium]